MKTYTNTIAKYIGMISLGVMLATGCTDSKKIVFQNYEKARGYDVVIEKYDQTSVIRLGNYDSDGYPIIKNLDEDECIMALDHNNDGTVDKINIFTKKGSSLDELANKDSIESIYKTILQK